MKLLVVVRLSPNNKQLHELVVSALKNIIDKGDLISSVFFTDDSVGIAQKDADRNVNFKEIQQKYIELLEKASIKLLVCGKAFRDKGYDVADIHPQFILSGNSELTADFLSVDRTLEF